MAIQRSRSRKRLVLTISLFSTIFIAQVFSSCEGNKTAHGTPGVKPDAAMTKKLYETKCAICHGFDGRQQYAGAKDISLTTMDKSQIILQISEGKGSMPPQKSVLTPEEIEALAEFVLQLDAK